MPTGSYILVVDDEYDLAEVVLMALEAAGYEAQTARNGREALEACARRMPGLILLDMFMPVMNGWEFAKAFHAKYGEAAPIVVITAAEQALQSAREIGAGDALPKPFDVEMLLATAERFRYGAQASRTS
jgi:CheY-like chemotaxis protein